MKETSMEDVEEMAPAQGVTSDSLVSAVLEEYEKRPYPAEDERVLSDRSWKLAPYGWWNGTGRLNTAPGDVPARILVAGCGTGNEAFNLARFSPTSKVLAVDFSAKAIEVAKRWKDASGIENIDFLELDLTADDFVAEIGPQGPFDLVSCHGVLSYVPEAVKALKNLHEVLDKNGCLYLGCNGSTHLSQRYRPVLGKLGCVVDKYSPDQKTRAKVALCDDLVGVRPGKGIANQSDGFIGSDIFGRVNQCYSLETWLGLAAEAGLTFLGNLKTTVTLSQLKYLTSINLLREQNLADIHAFADFCNPSAFHRMLFGKNGRLLPNFGANNLKALEEWRPLVNLWGRQAIPVMQKPFDRKVSFQLNIPGLYKDHSIEAKTYILEFFRLSDGVNTFGDIVKSIGSGLTVEQMAPILFRFYICGMINMRPPKFD